MATVFVACEKVDVDSQKPVISIIEPSTDEVVNPGDAVHFKVKDEHRIVSKAAYIALGINLEGQKEILGVWIGENEGAKLWLRVCTELKNRGINVTIRKEFGSRKGYRKNYNVEYNYKSLFKMV